MPGVSKSKEDILAAFPGTFHSATAQDILDLIESVYPSLLNTNAQMRTLLALLVLQDQWANASTSRLIDTDNVLAVVAADAATVVVPPGLAVIAEDGFQTRRCWWFEQVGGSENIYGLFDAPDAADPYKAIVIIQVTNLITGAAEIQVLCGTPDTEPQLPSLPDNALKIAEVTVPANEMDATAWTVENETPQDFMPSVADIAALDTRVTELEFGNSYLVNDQEFTTTTFGALGEFERNLAAGEAYVFKLTLFLLNDGATEGFKFQFEANDGLTVSDLKAQVSIYDDTLNTLVGFGRITAFTSAIGAALSAGSNYAVIEGSISVDAAGALTSQFAQNATGASAGVHIEPGSSMLMTKI